VVRRFQQQQQQQTSFLFSRSYGRLEMKLYEKKTQIQNKSKKEGKNKRWEGLSDKITSTV
jgi:hypothetical protein